MKTKKKIIISLSIAIMVLLIAVVVLVAVSSASNQNITSKVKVNFRPSPQVVAYVQAEYSFNANLSAMTTDGNKDNGKNNKLMFVYAERPTTKTLQMQLKDLKDGALILNNDVKEIIFSFKFKNVGSTNFTAYLDISGITTRENVSLTYSLDNNKFSSELPELLVEAGLFAENEKTCYVKISITDPAFDADFEGTFLWDLVAEEAY